MTSICKKHQWMNEWFSHDFHYQIMRKEVCDMLNVSISSSLICFKIFENVSKYKTIRYFKPSDDDSLELI
jgi:hypothetical protein